MGDTELEGTRNSTGKSKRFKKVVPPVVPELTPRIVEQSERLAEMWDRLSDAHRDVVLALVGSLLASEAAPRERVLERTAN